MSKTRGIIFEAEVSRDVEPGVVTLYDMSRYANNGVMTGVTWAQLPSDLWVMNLDGNDFINFGTGIYVPIGTFSTWFYTTASGAQQTLLAKDIGGQNNGDFTFDINMADDKIRLRLQDASPSSQSIFSNVAVNTAQWYHVVVLFGTGGMIMYVNSVAQTDTDAFTGGITNTAATFYLGGLAASFGLTGYLAMGELYNYRLSAGQILKRFEATRSLFGV